ncbi:MAG: sugar phosphate isomerase/epimerase [Actinobacteria bacterium]|nr:sugar phosphate isomerase/epimerase [Actinomycetota bacterium]
MRFSIATFVWTGSFTNEQLDLVPKVAELGYDDLEVVFDGSGGVDAGPLRERLEESGLGASVLAFDLPERDLSSPDQAIREAGISYLTDALDFAAAIGAEVVAGPIAHPPGRARPLPADERRAERAHAVESLRTVGERAGERGLLLGVEQLSRYDSDMFNTATETLALLADIDHDSVGMLLDTFHMQMEERSAGEAIRAAGDKLVHFHSVESHRGELGTGQIAWDDVFSALTEIGYERDVSVESFSMTGTEFDALVNMWRPWFDDADGFAGKSLAYARGQLDSVQ